MSTGGGANVKQRAVGGNGKRVPRPARLTVRPARRGDVVPLTFFFDTVLRRDYFMRRGQLEDLVNGRYHQVYVAEIDQVLVGVAITTGGSRLVNALVHPAYRGLGIGKALVSFSGVTEVRAKLDVSTGDPRGFYQSLGFVSTGVRNEKGNIEVLQLSPTAQGDTPQKRLGRNDGAKRNRVANSGQATAKHKYRK
jgi:GNAT superfamily N-acetyltransferase